ncbi:MAG: hypothetical protein JWO52_83 [Gammaproteobacteria bacterium]|jgi:hypothetical protein|nr:hypothetical protein [Gammaproteobacteria bacterium]
MKDVKPWAIEGLGESGFAALAEGMPASEVWSLLLSVIERRSIKRTPPAVLQQWEADRFVRPAPVDQRTFVELDSHLLAAAQGFEALELSPLAPLAACSSVALTSQNRTISTVRGTEVVSDPTNVLALESARRLRQDSRQVVRLATCHRCVRAQPFPKLPGFEAHFRIFCMTTAGRETQDRAFLTTSLAEHIQTHLSALDRLEKHGYHFRERRVHILATPQNEALGSRIATAIRDVPVATGPLKHGYYGGLRFRIDVGGAANEAIPLIDGGAFDWLHKLTSNQKLSFVASGMGSQLAAYLFRT